MAIFPVVIAWATVQRQITVATQETWLREFREQVALLMARVYALDLFMQNLKEHPQQKDLDVSFFQDISGIAHPIFTLELLLLERGGKAKYKEFHEAMETLRSIALSERIIDVGVAAM